MCAVNFFVDNMLANYKYPRCHELFPAIVGSWTSKAWWVRIPKLRALYPCSKLEFLWHVVNWQIKLTLAALGSFKQIRWTTRVCTKMLLFFGIFYGLGTPYGSVHQICFAEVSHYENRFLKVECQIGAWPRWVPPRKLVRTRFSYSEPRKLKCVLLAWHRMLIFISNLLKIPPCILELNHAARHDPPYVFFTFTAFRERAIHVI